MTMPNASVSGTSTTATTSTDNTQQQQHDTHQHLHEVEQPDNFEQGSSWTQITAMQAIVEDPLYAPCRDVIMRYGRCNSSLVRKFSGGW